MFRANSSSCKLEVDLWMFYKSSYEGVCFFSTFSVARRSSKWRRFRSRNLCCSLSKADQAFDCFLEVWRTSKVRLCFYSGIAGEFLSSIILLNSDKINIVIVKIGSLVEQGDKGPRGMSSKEQQFLSTGVFNLCVIVHSTKRLPWEKWP